MARSWLILAAVVMAAAFVGECWGRPRCTACHAMHAMHAMHLNGMKNGMLHLGKRDISLYATLHFSTHALMH